MFHLFHPPATERALPDGCRSPAPLRRNRTVRSGTWCRRGPQESRLVPWGCAHCRVERLLTMGMAVGGWVKANMIEKQAAGSATRHY